LKEYYLHIIDECFLEVQSDFPEMQAWLVSYNHHHRYRLANDLIMVHQYADLGARILEVGSAPFILTLALGKMGYKVIGVDIEPDRFGKVITKSNSDVLRLNVETGPLPFFDETFELILFNEIFEHLRINPILTMTEIRRVLKSEGSLFLSTPNLRSLRGIWMLIFQHKGGHVRPEIYDEYKKIELYGHMGHVREYTAREVSSFLTKVGFETKKTIFRFYGPIYQARLKAKILLVIEKTICSLFPHLKPLFTLVCVRGRND
jgi:2-polyprenyl-3-methyl-5-hydroxy-6-metoxy-1,4-benzoquinol methylase